MKTARMLAAENYSRRQPTEADSPRSLTEGNKSRIPERLIRVCLVLLAVVVSGCDTPSRGPEAVSLLRVHRARLDLVPASSGIQHKETAKEHESFKQTQAELVKSPYVLSAALRNPEVQQSSAIMSQDKPIDYLAQKLHISFPHGAEIMRVSLRCGDDEQSVAILNAVVESYLGEIVQSNREERTRKLETLRTQYREDVRQLQEKSKIVQDLGKMLGESARLAHLARHETKMLASRREEIWQQWSNTKLELALAQTSPEEGDNAATIATRKVEFLAQLLEEVNQKYEESKVSTASMQVPGFSSDLVIRQLDLDSVKSSVAEIDREIRRLELNLRTPPRILLLQPAMMVTSDKE